METMLMESFVYLSITFFLAAFPKSSALRATNSTPSHEHRLMKELFKFYDDSVRPRYNSSSTVDVRVRFSLQQINDLDEKRQILKMSGWLTAEWTDDFLTWDPEEFGGLSKLVVEPSKLWVPKLAIGNSANRLFDGEHYKRFWVTVRSTGEVRWQPGGVFAIACALDMNFYPFDDQHCTMEIETWVYTADKVNLSNSLDRVGLETYIPHGEWTIMKTSVRSINKVYPYYLTESFPEVYCTIYIRRKYTFYFLYILLPCLMLSGVLVMVFLLPADSGEKVSLGVSVLVAISVFLLIVAGSVPDTSDAVPIIAIYLTYFMMVTTLSVAFSVLVIKIHFHSPDYRPPQWLRVLIFSYMAKLVCINVKYPKRRRHNDVTWSDVTEDVRSNNSTLSPDMQEHVELSKRGILQEDSSYDVASANQQRLRPQDLIDPRPQHNEWKQMAEVLDRFFFYLFLLFLLVPTSTILGVVRLFKPEL